MKQIKSHIHDLAFLGDDDGVYCMDIDCDFRLTGDSLLQVLKNVCIMGGISAQARWMGIRLRDLGEGEMNTNPNIRFKDWEAEQMQDPEFRAAVEELEPAYQVARLRIKRGS